MLNRLVTFSLRNRPLICVLAVALLVLGGRALSVLANVPALIAFLRADVARLRGDAAGAVDFGRRALAQVPGAARVGRWIRNR